MEKKHKDLLLSKHVFLTNELDLTNTHVLDYLYQDRLLSANDIQEIESKRSTGEKASYFLRMILPRRGPRVFQRFIRALVKQDQSELAKELDEELATRFNNEEEEDNGTKHGTLKNVLQDNHIYLLTSLDLAYTDLSNELLSRGVLTQANIENLERYASNSMKAHFFLVYIMPTKSQKTIQDFIQALEVTQEEVAETLNNYLRMDEVDSGVTKQFLSDEEIVKLLSDRTKSAFQEPRSSIAKVKPEDAYMIGIKSHGQAIIINNKFFGANSARLKSNFDEELLKQLFKRLHFNVESHQGVTTESILELVSSVSDDNDQECGAFVMCLLSHGCDGYVLGVDGKKVSIDELVREVGKSEKLRNKPKIFLIQGCRYEKNMAADRKLDSNLDIVDGSRFSPAGNEMVKSMSKTRESDAQASGNGPMAHDCKDIFIAHSTIPEHLSWPSEDIGSWFIRFFVYICSSRAHVEDLSGMLLHVTRLLSLRPKMVGHEQMEASVLRGLSKKIYFLP